MNVSGSPARASPSRNAGVRSAWAASIASTIASGAGGPDPRSSSASAYAIRIPPALGGGLVSTSRPW